MWSSGRRMFSQVAKQSVPHANPAAARTVVAQRQRYAEELSGLRKEWRGELADKAAREEQKRAAERQRLVLEKAIRLREKRKASLARQEAAKKKREEALSRYREKLARNHLLEAQRVARQNERFRNLVGIMEAESSVWITPENVDTKINEDLFSAPATTGLVTNESKHWRYQLLTIQLKRLMSQEYLSEAAGSSLADRLQQRGQLKSVRKMLVEEFLAPMIGSGAERANYQEILDKFVHELGDFDTEDGDLERYFDYIVNKDDAGEDEGWNLNSASDEVSPSADDGSEGDGDEILDDDGEIVVGGDEPDLAAAVEDDADEDVMRAPKQSSLKKPLKKI